VLKPLLGSYNPVAPLEAKRKIREKKGGNGEKMKKGWSRGGEGEERSKTTLHFV